MTTPWSITPIWRGETVAVLASGPSMSQSVADALRKHRTIVVNHTHRLAPWADMLVALDINLPLWESARDFAGIKICGAESDKINAMYAGQWHERVKMGPSHTVQIVNSGLAAIRIAVAMGASKIILAGFDPDKAGHFAGRPHSRGHKPHDAVGIGLVAVIAELRARGIEVEMHAAAEPQADIVQAKKSNRRVRRVRGGLNV